MVSTKNKKKSTSFFLLSLLVFLASGIFSCTRDSAESESVNFQVDFLINKLDVPSLEEYSSDDLLNNDSLYSLKIRIGSLISFQDITDHTDKIKTWEWTLKSYGSDENVEGKEVLSTSKNFEYRPSEEGRYEIELWINGSVAGTGKVIDVLEELAEDYIPPFDKRSEEYIGTSEIEDIVNEEENTGEYDTEDPITYEEPDDVIAYNDEVDNQVVEPEVMQDIPSQDEPDLREKGSAPTRVIPADPVSSKPENRKSVEPAKPSKPSKSKTTPVVTRPVKKIPTISSVFFKRSTAVAKIGNKVSFEDVSQDKSLISTRTWDFGDGTTPITKDGNTANVSHVFKKAGEFKIKLCLNNTSKDCITRTVKIIKEEDKKPLFSSVSFDVPQTIYKGESISLIDKSIPQKNILNRYWDFGDNTPSRSASKSTTTYTYNKTGSYAIKLCLNNKDGKDCITKKIKVIEPIPDKPSITLSDIKITASKNKGEVGESFNFSDKTIKEVKKREWYIGNQLIGSGKTFNHIFKEAGTYKVKLCLEGDKSLCKDVSINVNKKTIIKKEVVGDFYDYNLKNKGTSGFLKTCSNANDVSSGITKITPSEPISLDEFTVHTDGGGSIFIELSYTDIKGEMVRDKFTKSVNTGQTQVGLTDFGIILLPGSTFTLKVTSSTVKFKDSSSCGSSQNGKGATMKSSGIVHNLKYYY